MKKIHLNAFTQCCINHHSEGQWKHPLDGSARGYRDIDYWVDLARLLEQGGFTCLFLADVHGTYSVYRGSRETAVRHAVQFPSNEPTVIIPAMAHATRTLGFAATYSTTYFPPYQTAKLFSTLDHLARGRVGWNIVTSYLADANANFGIREELGHDERYDRADEYMDVVYKLWEHSWEEDAVVRDVGHDVYSDPGRVHTIDHVGRWYEVPGPHMCEPSPQRTPFLFQAGQSGRGTDFAAKHAEAIFCVHANLEVCARGVAKLRAAIAKAGRAPDEVKVCQGISVVVAPTDAEARLKLETCRSYASPEGSLALFSGWAGIDLSTVEPDRPLDTLDSNAIQGVLSYFKDVDPDRRWTVREMGEWISVASIMPKIVGSPATVADELERWIDETGIDGINLVPITQPGGFRDFAELVVPELRRRGRLHALTPGATLREQFFGPGRARLPRHHAAFSALPPWKTAPR
ncbi:MAG: LLM class flavin-dependent oxidoreductase [Gammaproteobacteria bacterium]|nr:LLM class flavin-dependent oxidoreductase [Gammaproteobacteria bacterium]